MKGESGFCILNVRMARKMKSFGETKSVDMTGLISLKGHSIMTTSLKTAWKLWEDTEKGWETAKPAKGKPDPTPPKAKANSSSDHEPEIVVAQSETPSKLNSLENEDSFVPGHDKDADLMQLETELDRLEEALLEYELAEMMTPDVGVSNYGLGLLGGGIGLNVRHTYDRNYCPDPPAPEESGDVPSLDPSNTLLAPKTFIPKEDKKAIAERMEQDRRTRLKKLQS